VAMLFVIAPNWKMPQINALTWKSKEHSDNFSEKQLNSMTDFIYIKGLKIL
jgi:hypothetical protein